MFHWYLYPLKSEKKGEQNERMTSSVTLNMKKIETTLSIQMKESEKHMFRLTNSFISVYIGSQLLDHFKCSLFKQQFCSSLHLLHIRVSRCCCKPACVQVSSEKEETTKWYPARSLLLETVPFLFFFPSYIVLRAFLKITLLYFTRTQMPKLRVTAATGRLQSQESSKLNTGLKTHIDSL